MYKMLANGALNHESQGANLLVPHDALAVQEMCTTLPSLNRAAGAMHSYRIFSERQSSIRTKICVPCYQAGHLWPFYVAMTRLRQECECKCHADKG